MEKILAGGCMMCGRFTLAYEDWSNLLAWFQIDVESAHLPPRYNIAPTQAVHSVIERNGERRLGSLRWGLIPHFADDIRVGNKTINARAESLRERPAYRSLLAKKRCLILADGFYEWNQHSRAREPYRIQLKTERYFAFAGLYDSWKNTNGQVVHSCTVITTEANTRMSSIHHRMPVILKRTDQSRWLREEATDFEELLRPLPDDDLTMYPVSPKVGDANFESPMCLTPYVDPQLTLGLDLD